MKNCMSVWLRDAEKQAERRGIERGLGSYDFQAGLENQRKKNNHSLLRGDSLCGTSFGFDWGIFFFRGCR